MNDLIPNSYQTPNILVDRLMPLLHADEWVALSFAVRQILGFHDRIVSRRARISLSKFAESGLPNSTLRRALEALDEYRILNRIGAPTQDGQLWELAFDDPVIDWTGLQERRQRELDKARKKTDKARKARCVVPQQTGGVVPQHTPENPPPGEEVCCPTTQGVLSHNRNQTQDVVVESESDSHPVESTTTGPSPHPTWSSTELQIVQNECRRVGFASSKPIRAILFNREPVVALGLIFQAEDRATHSKGGLLRRMLETDGQPEAEYLELARQRLAPPIPSPASPYDPDGRERDPEPPEDEEMDPEPGEEMEFKPIARPPLPPKIGVDQPLREGNALSMKDAWYAMLGQLQLALQRTTFEVYLKGSEAWQYQEGRLLVKVRHEYAADWCQKNQHIIARPLKSIAGMAVQLDYFSVAVDGQVVMASEANAVMEGAVHV